MENPTSADFQLYGQDKEKLFAAMSAFDRLPKTLRDFFNFHREGWTNETILSISDAYHLKGCSVRSLAAELHGKFGKPDKPKRSK
jgi:hypothetical protein